MAWERFHAACRREQACGAASADAEGLRAYYFSNRDASLLGNAASPGSLPGELVTALDAQPPGELRRRAIDAYAALDLDALAAAPAGALRLAAYLSLLAAMMAVMLGIQTVFVLPQLEALMPDGAEVGAAKALLRPMAPLPLAMLALIIYLWVAGFALRSLFGYRWGLDSSPALARALPPSLRRSQRELAGLIAAPLPDLVPQELRAELQSLQASGLDPLRELPAMLRLKAQAMERRAQRFLQILFALTAVAVLVFAAVLMNTLYAPIFVMGGVL